MYNNRLRVGTHLSTPGGSSSSPSFHVRHWLTGFWPVEGAARQTHDDRISPLSLKCVKMIQIKSVGRFYSSSSLNWWFHQRTNNLRIIDRCFVSDQIILLFMSLAIIKLLHILFLVFRKCFSVSQNLFNYKNIFHHTRKGWVLNIYID